jgi:hypothetical protein
MSSSKPSRPNSSSKTEVTNWATLSTRVAFAVPHLFSFFAKCLTVTGNWQGDIKLNRYTRIDYGMRINGEEV